MPGKIPHFVPFVICISDVLLVTLISASDYTNFPFVGINK